MVAGRGVQVLWRRIGGLRAGAFPLRNHQRGWFSTWTSASATTRGRSAAAASLANCTATGRRMYSSDNLGFSSSSRKLKWGFVEAGEALAAHRARPINQNASLLLWITSNTLQLCSVDQADIEEGARQAYRHIAELYEEGSSEAWLSQRRSVISLDLAQEFASQADAYKVNGMRPKLRIESVDARVLYAIWLPEDMSVDFRLSDYPDATTPWGRMSRWVGWNAAKLRTMTKFMRQIWNQNEGETTCIHLLVHVTGFEDCQLVQGGEGGEGWAADAQPFDHLLLFETKVHWHNLRREIPISVVEGEAPMTEGPEIAWQLRDMNNHLVNMGRRREFNLSFFDDP